MSSRNAASAVPAGAILRNWLGLAADAAPAAIEAALLRRADKPTPDLDLNHLLLAALVAEAEGWRAADRRWPALAAAVARQQHSVADPAVAAQLHLARLAMLALVEGRAAALAQMVPVLVDDARLKDLAPLHEALWQVGFLRESDPPALAEQAVAALAPFAGNGERATTVILRALILLGLPVHRHVAWGDAVMAGAALPLLHAAIARGCLDAALTLENALYPWWLTRHENERHYEDSFRRWAPAFIEAGRKAGAALPPLRAGGDRLGVFVHQASMLAHIVCLLDGLAAMRAVGRLPPTTVYVWGGRDAAMAAACAALGVELLHLDAVGAAPPVGAAAARFAWLRGRLAQDGVGTLLWMCMPVWQSYAFALRLAPRQLWWSVKYHPAAVAAAGADLLLSLHGRARDTVSWHGRTWSTLPYLVRHPVPAERPEEAAALRRGFDCGCLFFTPSRPEKLTEPEFLNTVAAILRASGGMWAYPGHTDHPGLRDYFARAGLADRVRWIGWVDTGLWAQAADVVLDSFPHSTGLTGALAMGAGAPFVFRLLPETHDGFGMYDMLIADPAIRGLGDPQEVAEIRAIFDGGLLMAAASTGAFIDHAVRLAADPALRRASGAAGRAWATRFLAEETMLGNRLADAVAMPADKT